MTTHLIRFTLDFFVYLMGHCLSGLPAFECGDPVPILRIFLFVKSQMWRGVIFHCASGVPPQVVSEAQHWQCGAGAHWSDGVHSVITKQILYSKT